MSFKILLIMFPIALFMGCTTGGVVINAGDRVSIEYQASVQNYSFDQGTITFVVADKSVIPGLEAGIIGMKAGEFKEFSVPAGLAYGEYDESLVLGVPHEVFENEPELYDEVNLMGRYGIIVEIIDDYVIVDLNHWLAGEEIYFKVKVLTIEKL